MKCCRSSHTVGLRITKLEMKKKGWIKDVCGSKNRNMRKGKKIRTAPLINSLQYYKAWIARHPMAGNPNDYLLISYENSAKYRNAPLGSASLLGIYSTYVLKHHFLKLLERPDDVSPEDKIKISQLLQDLWNTFIPRHTGLHEKVRLLNEHMLRQHAGWKKTSSMIEIYTHELGDEISENSLLAYGIDVKKTTTNEKKQPQDYYSPRHARIAANLTCQPQNLRQLPDGVTFDAFIESMKDAEESKKERIEMKAELKILQANTSNLFKVFLASWSFTA